MDVYVVKQSDRVIISCRVLCLENIVRNFYGYIPGSLGRPSEFKGPGVHRRNRALSYCVHVAM